MAWAEGAYRWACFAGFILAGASLGAEPVPLEKTDPPAGAIQDTADAPGDSSSRTGAPPPPSETTTPASEAATPATGLLFMTEQDPPLGITGPSRIPLPDIQQDNNFIPIADRWRIGFPPWDRYGKGHPLLDEYPYVQGAAWDTYRQHYLKADYPILGQDVFLNLSGTNLSIFDFRRLPTDTPHLPPAANSAAAGSFARSDQFFYRQYFRFAVDLFQGDAAFKPPDWRIRITPVFNINFLAFDQQAVTDPTRRMELDRGRTFLALEEWFFEYEICDLSADYDFLSVRVGSQFFTSDFRGFIFTDTNRAVRLFGT